MENSPSISSLLCDEDPINLNNERVEETYPVTEDDDEYMKMLLDKDVNGNGHQMQEFPNVISENWIKEARPDAVQYIVNTGEKFCFRLHTAYLAIIYLDTFLSRKPFESEQYWLVRLSAMACLSLAAKMEENYVPVLSKFPRDLHDFDNKRIMKMEGMVLAKLQWRMKKLTPFAFTHYLASKFSQSNSIRDIPSRVEEVIMVSIMANEKMLHNRPSTMAAAATLLIIDRGLTRETLELRINTSSLGGYLQIEDVFSIYNQMKEMGVEKYESSNIEMSPLLSPYQIQRTRTMENYVVSSSRSGKRRSLTFSESDQSSERDKKRPS